MGIALANAVARVSLGAHNPLDVVGGAAIGVALGGVLTMVMGNPVQEATADGAAEAGQARSK